MKDNDYKELKCLTSTMYSICNSLWPDEFTRYYLAKPQVFRDWLNQKTGLNVDHTIDKKNAIAQWVDVLLHLVN